MKVLAFHPPTEYDTPVYYDTIIFIIIVVLWLLNYSYTNAFHII